jgi:hypothetical protein
MPRTAKMAAGLRVVIQLGRGFDGRRMLDAIGVVSRRADGLVDVRTAVQRRGSQWADGVARTELGQLLAGRDDSAGVL